MLTAWINHPITQEMLRLVSEKLEANELELTGVIVEGPSLGVIDLHLLSQLRGQILAYKEVLKTKEFLMELTEDGVEHGTESSRTQTAG